MTAASKSQICTRTTTDSVVQVEENKCKASFENSARAPYTITRVDGCVIKNSIAADFVVNQAAHGDAIIELKGTDVEHGIKQLTATARHWVQQRLRQGSVAALIVCRRYPRFDTKVRKGATEFRRTFGGHLHVRTHVDKREFKKLFTPAGP